ncbi:hypothetical protein [Shimia sp. MMG029]|uniref:hypothetical protein n=1 Tax=Shimia sp. MMG029 TaxID=3021978 RepID=UPI0022FE3AC8|nr:hypothetical protein [Shimia sp. MMG029]MDA5555794.1 hypothetical protein [Shimia sp. MMG029]
MKINHLRRVAMCSLFVAGSVLYFNGAAEAQTDLALPDIEIIEASLISELPGYWELVELDATTPVNSGDEINPLVRWRFEAHISPTEDLFKEISHEANTTIVSPTAADDSSTTVYGIASATYKAGNWNIELELENRPYDNRGQPEGFFKGRVVHQGSEDEVALIQERMAQLLSEGKEALALELEQEKARLETSVETLIAELNVKRQKARELAGRDLQTLKDEHANAVEVLKSELATRLETLRLEGEAEAERLKTTLEQELALAELGSKVQSAIELRKTSDSELVTALTNAADNRAKEIDTLLERVMSADAVQLQALFDAVAKDGPDWLIEGVIDRALSSEVVSSKQLFAIAGKIENADTRVALQSAVLMNSNGEAGIETQQFWASEVLDFSDQYKRSSDAVLGAKDVVDCEGPGSWSAPNIGRAEYITVAFGQPLFLTDIDVFQGSGVGFVTNLTIRNLDGSENTISVDDTTEECPGVLSVPIDGHYQPVVSVTVHTNTAHSTRYEGIDAIKAYGFPVDG